MGHNQLRKLTVFLLFWMISQHTFALVSHTEMLNAHSSSCHELVSTSVDCTDSQSEAGGFHSGAMPVCDHQVPMCHLIAAGHTSLALVFSGHFTLAIEPTVLKPISPASLLFRPPIV